LSWGLKLKDSDHRSKRFVTETANVWPHWLSVRCILKISPCNESSFHLCQKEKKKARKNQKKKKKTANVWASTAERALLFKANSTSPFCGVVKNRWRGDGEQLPGSRGCHYRVQKKLKTRNNAQVPPQNQDRHVPLTGVPAKKRPHFLGHAQGIRR
jgi:hypothetical protein